MIKGVFTDIGFANAVKAQQVLGGHGYIAEWGMEQFVRDARIAMIYEGANGIQALDLVGRKLPKDGGRAVMAFFGEVSGFLAENKARRRARSPISRPLKAALGQLQQATMWLMQNAHRRTRTTPAPARPTTCICSASSRSATCGRGSSRRCSRGRANGDSNAGARRRKLATRQILHRAYAARDAALIWRA